MARLPGSPALIHAERPARLLVIAAHPLDADRWMGATVAAWTRAGTVARLVCCTSGETSGADASADPLEHARDREAAQRTVAESLGYEAVVFLHQPDGALADDLAVREQLVRIIRQLRPDAVAAPDVSEVVRADGSIVPADERAAGLAALDAVEPAAHRAMAFPHLAISEGLSPHRVERLYLYDPATPSALVDVSDTLEVKLGAVGEHETRPVATRATVDALAAAARQDGQRVGVAAAEGFRVIELG